MLAFRRDAAARRVVVMGRGELTAVDVRAFIDWQILDGCWEYGVLYDMRSVTRILTGEEQAELVAYIASMTTHLPPRGPIAVLTDDAAMADRVSEYGRVGVRAALRVKTFSDESTAVRWLDENTADPPLQFDGPSH
jgi:hypothetical protein